MEKLKYQNNSKQLSTQETNIASEIKIDFPKLLDKRFFVEKVVGIGSFGVVYEGIDSYTNKKVAIKIQKIGNSNFQQTMLTREAYIMGKFSQFPGFCKIISQGYNPKFQYLVMQLLDKNLECLMQQQKGGKISLLSTAIISLQIIESLQVIHEKGFLHRDIKPENFMIGFEKEQNQIFIIDFGLAKQYSQKLLQSKQNQYRGLVGTARYASINAHKGKDQTRKDDLESWCYLMIYFIMGKLPWQNLPIKDKKEKFNKICQLKEQFNFNQLCFDCPQEFLSFFNYIKTLNQFEIPNYNFLKNQMQSYIYRETTLKIYNPFNLDPELLLDWQSNNKQDQIIDLQNSTSHAYYQQCRNEIEIVNEDELITQCDLDMEEFSSNAKDFQNYTFNSYSNILSSIHEVKSFSQKERIENHCNFLQQLSKEKMIHSAQEIMSSEEKNIIQNLHIFYTNQNNNINK